jgi:hypothetical protein
VRAAQLQEASRHAAPHLHASAERERLLALAGALARQHVGLGMDAKLLPEACLRASTEVSQAAWTPCWSRHPLHACIHTWHACTGLHCLLHSWLGHAGRSTCCNASAMQALSLRQHQGPKAHVQYVPALKRRGLNPPHMAFLVE